MDIAVLKFILFICLGKNLATALKQVQDEFLSHSLKGVWGMWQRLTWPFPSERATWEPKQGCLLLVISVVPWLFRYHLCHLYLQPYISNHPLSISQFWMSIKAAKTWYVQNSALNITPTNLVFPHWSSAQEIAPVLPSGLSQTPQNCL